MSYCDGNNEEEFEDWIRQTYNKKLLLEKREEMRCPDCLAYHDKEEAVIVSSAEKIVIYSFPCGAKIELKNENGNWTQRVIQQCMGFRFRQ